MHQCCVPLHTLLYVYACCCVLLGVFSLKFETGQTFRGANGRNLTTPKIKIDGPTMLGVITCVCTLLYSNFVNLVPRVLSYPPYGARGRETLENAGHVFPRIWEITNKRFGGGAGKCEICLYRFVSTERRQVSNRSVQPWNCVPDLILNAEIK